MAYTDFDFESLSRLADIVVRQAPLFGQAARVEPTSWLGDTLRKGHNVALLSEKSRSEFIVAPILLTCREMLGDEYHLYSGVRLDVDPARGLRGECDFILAKTPPSPALRAPLLVVVEAKKNDIEEGIPQCAAQMLAARLFNEGHQHPVRCIHGCVTTGEAWQFLRLEDQTLWVDAERVYIADVARILGILTTLMRESA